MLAEGQGTEYDGRALEYWSKKQLMEEKNMDGALDKLEDKYII